MTNEKVIEYIKAHPDYSVCGETKYLGIDGKKPDIARELFALKDCSKPLEDSLALKPVYMKD